MDSTTSSGCGVSNSNLFLKLYIDVQVEPQLFTTLLLNALVRELHNSIVVTPGEGALKEARDADNNIIISDSTLRNILPPQLKKMTSQYKVVWNYERCISDKSMHSSLLSWGNFCLKYLKDRCHNAQNRRSGKYEFLFLNL